MSDPAKHGFWGVSKLGSHFGKLFEGWNMVHGLWEVHPNMIQRPIVSCFCPQSPPDLMIFRYFPPFSEALPLGSDSCGSRKAHLVRAEIDDQYYIVWQPSGTHQEFDGCCLFQFSI